MTHLHEYKLPFAGEHLLQLGQVLSLVIGQFQSRLVLHSAFAEIYSIIRILGFPTIRWPEIWCLKSVQRVPRVISIIALKYVTFIAYL